MQVGLNIHDKHFDSVLRIIVLLYADDTVLFAELAGELQRDIIKRFCIILR